MARRRKTEKNVRPVFDSIRKPTAPPTKKISPEKPEDKQHPAMRKAKHKPKDELE
ncbi:MAG: hypothetical protein KA956_02120 [Pyrinomonadaceae bacterium]|nr:hypothetical protein [Acidobacteriota bacterium]MBP7375253.1 hypothetical protein [Pyrinomonadaceae bacterium]